MSHDAILETTEIEGLHWEKNLVVPGETSGVHVIASSGPAVTDLVTHSPEFGYNHYGIHIAQVDRLTFFGDPTQKITGYFVDCRSGSKTLHKQVIQEYYPDPRKKLHIDRGIAHTFDGLQNVLTWDEPVWYLSAGNPDYNIAHDVLNVSRNLLPEDFPVVTINRYPIPREAYQFVLRIQHRTLQQMLYYPTRYRVMIDGREHYVTLTPKGPEGQGGSEKSA